MFSLVGFVDMQYASVQTSRCAAKGAIRLQPIYMVPIASRTLATRNPVDACQTRRCLWTNTQARELSNKIAYLSSYPMKPFATKLPQVSHKYLLFWPLLPENTLIHCQKGGGSPSTMHCWCVKKCNAGKSCNP